MKEEEKKAIKTACQPFFSSEHGKRLQPQWWPSQLEVCPAGVQAGPPRLGGLVTPTNRQICAGVTNASQGQVRKRECMRHGDGDGGAGR